MEKESRSPYRPVSQMSDTERIRTVKEIFSTVTGKYDFLNHLLSLRRDIAWRRFAVRKMRFFRTDRLLDVATGTADLAIEAAQRHASIRVAGLDFVQAMMKQGPHEDCGKRSFGPGPASEGGCPGSSLSLITPLMWLPLPSEYGTFRIEPVPCGRWGGPLCREGR